MIDFDVETTGLQPYSGNQHAFLYIFMGDDLKPEAIPFDAREWREYQSKPHTMIATPLTEAHRRIQWWFDRAKEEGIRAWNSKFDRAWADQEGFDIPGDGMWHDGMLDAQAINENRSVALKSIAKELFGEDAADLQKQVHQWLNDENKRRRKVEKDAEKAEANSLRIAYVQVTYSCDHTADTPPHLATSENGPCPQCGEDGVKGTKNRTRKATDEEKIAVIEEAKLYRREDGTFIHANFSDVPADLMNVYGMEDVILTRKAGDVHDQILMQKPDLKKVVEFEQGVMDALYAIEKRGLPARPEEYRKLELEVIENLEDLEERVQSLADEGDRSVYLRELYGKDNVEVSEDGRILSFKGGDDTFNPNSTPKILAALKARGADLSYMSEKDGKVGADKDNLKAVDDELAAAILEFRSEYKVLTTYVRPMIGRHYESGLKTYKEPFIGPDNRIHANYRQVGARTGRMSCSDPNMQNQPRDDLRLRYNIVADPGKVLVACDLSNIEMVLFAAYCGEGRLLDAVRRGEDLHMLTARMLGLRDRERAGGYIESARQLGKTYNFSRIYGGGLRTIRRQFRCSMDQARLLKKRFDDAYPEVQRLQHRIDYRLQDQGYIQDRLISGRRFRVDQRDSYKAVNYLVQGTAAALLKYAVVNLHRDGVPMVALVHDEIVAHVDKSEAEEAQALIIKRMTEHPGLEGVVPLKAEGDIVNRWSDAKPMKDGSLFVPKWAQS
jgi:DNA polymerase I-like protein with 3'-5' exonuclease and polymerase domains